MVDFGEGFEDVAVFGFVGGDDDGDGFSGLGFVLVEAGEGDFVFGEDVGDLGHDAGDVECGDAAVVSGDDLGGGEEGGGGFVGEEGEFLEEERRGAEGDGEDVGEDGGGGGFSAGAAADVNSLTGGVSGDGVGVEGAVDVGQELVGGDEGGMDSEGEAVGGFFADGEKFAGVVEFFGEFEVDVGEGVDAGAVDFVEGDFCAEGEGGEDGEFVCGVGAVDVEGGVCFGEAGGLGAAEGVGVGLLVLGHLGEDVVAGAVDDADDAGDVVGEEGLGECGDDGDGSAAGSFELDAFFGAFGGGEDFLAVDGEEVFVGGDDVFAGFEGFEDEGAGGFEAADEFDDDVGVGVFEGGVEGGGVEFWGDTWGFGDVGGAVDDVAELEGSAGAFFEEGGFVEEGVGDGGADDAAADDGDAGGGGGFGHGFGSPGKGRG